MFFLIVTTLASVAFGTVAVLKGRKVTGVAVIIGAAFAGVTLLVPPEPSVAGALGPIGWSFDIEWRDVFGPASWLLVGIPALVTGIVAGGVKRALPGSWWALRLPIPWEESPVDANHGHTESG